MEAPELWRIRWWWWSRRRRCNGGAGGAGWQRCLVAASSCMAAWSDSFMVALSDDLAQGGNGGEGADGADGGKGVLAAQEATGLGRCRRKWRPWRRLVDSRRRNR